MSVLIAHAASGTPFSVTTASTPPRDTTGANLIILACGWEVGPLTPTDSEGNSWVALNAYTFSNTSARIFYCLNPTTSTTHTFTLTNGVAFTFPVIVMQAWDATDPAGTGLGFDVQNGNTGGPATQPVPAGPVTPSHDHEITVTSVVSINAAGILVSAGFTVTDFNGKIGSGLGMGMAFLIQGPLATVNPVWTGPGVAIQVANIAAFTPALTAPPAPTVQLSIDSVAGIAGGTVTMTLSIASTGGLECSDLAFTLGFNPSDLTLLEVAPGSASTAAGKTVMNSGNHCEISGINQNVIADGVLATLVFQISGNPSTNSILVSLLGISASDPNANPLAASQVPGMITLPGSTPALIVLAPGLVFNPFTGQITGTPTQAGTFCTTFKVTDSLGLTATITCCITISAGILVYVLNYRELDTAAQIAAAMPIHTSLSGKLIATDHTRKWTRWNIPPTGAALMYRSAEKTEPVFWFGGNVYTLDASRLTDDDLGQIYPYYTTYFFVTHDLEGQLSYMDPKGQRAPLGSGRKLLAYLKAYIAAQNAQAPGTCQITVTPFIDNLQNPWALVGVRTLYNMPKFDLEWGGGMAQGDRIALQFASSPITGTDNGFTLQRLTAFLKRAQRLQIRGAAQ